jgi:hypothetical protein
VTVDVFELNPRLIRLIRARAEWPGSALEIGVFVISSSDA